MPRSRMSLSTFAPPAFIGPVAVPAAAVLAVIELHLNIVRAAPALALWTVLGRGYSGAPTFALLARPLLPFYTHANHLAGL